MPDLRSELKNKVLPVLGLRRPQPSSPRKPNRASSADVAASKKHAGAPRSDNRSGNQNGSRRARSSGSGRRRNAARGGTRRGSNTSARGGSSPSRQAVMDAYYSSGSVGSTPTAGRKPPTASSRRQLPLPGWDHVPNQPVSSEFDFKLPEPWVLDGRELNLGAVSNGARPLEVTIGIDFGTSFTKVAIRAADKVFFVPWDGISNSSNRFFLPSEVSLCSDGAFVPGCAPDAKTVFRDLKLPYLSNSSIDPMAARAATAYLAWVMQCARAWLFRDQASMLSGRRLIWVVNVGIPAESTRSRRLIANYKALALRAWALSQQSEGINQVTAVEVGGIRVSEAIDVSLEYLALVPEFAAQLAGYVKSTQFREGLHCLVDIGAGTTDVAVFNTGRHRNGDRFSLFSTSVERLGTHFLMQQRIEAAHGKNHDFAWRDNGAVPAAQAFATGLECPIADITRIDRAFSGFIGQQVGRALGETKRLKYPNAPEWQTGLTVFITGGGSHCEPYPRGVEVSFNRIRTPCKRASFPLLEEATAQVGRDNFHRVSVAFGLTYDAEDIGEIYNPDQIGNAERPHRRVNLPDHTEMYS